MSGEVFHEDTKGTQGARHKGCYDNKNSPRLSPLGSLEVWKLGGLVTPTPRGIRIEAADFADFGQMWDVLAHAGVPERKG